ncbi:MAG: response regulator [Acidimicrobiia bacterium]|nr:response regulator [Acidimicrobiia bacterium]
MTMAAATESIRVNGDGVIVMVDDSLDDFYIADLMYGRCKLDNEFVHCESGDALMLYLDQLTESGDSQPALILMDLNMPGMDGIETTALLRSKAEFESVPVIAMLTSTVDRQDRQRAASAGANAYLSKPLNPTDYIELFNSFAD